LQKIVEPPKLFGVLLDLADLLAATFRVGDRVECVDTHCLGTVVYLYQAAAVLRRRRRSGRSIIILGRCGHSSIPERPGVSSAVGRQEIGVCEA
jgi:hypothetical protein